MVASYGQFSFSEFCVLLLFFAYGSRFCLFAGFKDCTSHALFYFAYIFCKRATAKYSWKIIVQCLVLD